MFGTPTASVGGIVAMLTATIMSVIDSIADYYATAIVAGASPARLTTPSTGG